MVLILSLTIVLVCFFFFIEMLSNRGYLNTKQYRIYIFILFLGLFILAVLIDKECDKPNQYNTTLNK